MGYNFIISTSKNHNILLPSVNDRQKRPNHLGIIYVTPLYIVHLVRGVREKEKTTDHTPQRAEWKTVATIVTT